MMSLRVAILCSTIGIAASLAPASAGARVYLDVQVAPPASRVEVIPQARSGYVWSPGYYNWSGRNHVWVNGHYIRGRRGHHWVADRWEQHGDRWHHERGRWDHD